MFGLLKKQNDQTESSLFKKEFKRKSCLCGKHTHTQIPPSLSKTLMLNLPFLTVLGKI